MMRFVFFSMNDFTRQGGGTIRMQGIINELAAMGHEVVFVSNINAELANTLFHAHVKHHTIWYKFSQKDKRVFQALLGLLPVSVLNSGYRKFLNRLRRITEEVFKDEPVYFCEYLDNSIG